ncbi:MAG: phosphotransferase, partial [Candidatus Thorarchaeota archaeon]
MSEKDEARPSFSAEDAVRIAFDTFGVQATAEEFPSERDRNFLLMESGQPSYVLKFAASSEKRETLEFQNAAMKHLGESGTGNGRFVVPKVIPSITGDDLSVIEDSHGNKHYIRLVTYLPGRVFAEINPHTDEFLYGFGEFVGTLSKDLETFDHPATHRDFYWDLKNSPPLIAQYRDLIQDEEKRELVDYFNQLFDDRVVPNIRGLRTSVNHNDANDTNVLVEKSWDRNERRFGLLDFGDMVYSCTAFELAIATAYAIL